MISELLFVFFFSFLYDAGRQKVLAMVKHILICVPAKWQDLIGSPVILDIETERQGFRQNSCPFHTLLSQPHVQRLGRKQFAFEAAGARRPSLLRFNEDVKACLTTSKERGERVLNVTNF